MLDNGKEILYACKFCKSAIFSLLEGNVPAMPKGPDFVDGFGFLGKLLLA